MNNTPILVLTTVLACFAGGIVSDTGSANLAFNQLSTQIISEVPKQANNYVGEPHRVFTGVKECTWSEKQQKEVSKICKKYRIPFQLCISQAFQESDWDIQASGDDGLAYGAWQIHPHTWSDELKRWGYSFNDMYKLVPACETYCRIMRAHLDKYKSTYIALMAWRWGGLDGYRKFNQSGADTYSTKIVDREKRYKK